MKQLITITLLLLSTIFMQSNSFAGGGGSSGYVNPPAGMPACGSQSAPGQTACNATPICDINGYCGRTLSSYTRDTWSQLTNAFSNCGGSSGASIENNAFLTFTATASSISFDAYVYDCDASEAIQVMLFSSASCSSGPVTNLACVDKMYARNTPYNVSANGLVAGNNYYIMIDGFGGDVCSYTFVATSGVAQPISLNIPQNDTICAGESLAVTASGGLGTFDWSGGPGLGATTGATVTITPPATPGVYNYHVESTGTVSLCPSSMEYDFSITVIPNTATQFTQIPPICSGSPLTLPTVSNNGITGSWSPAANNTTTTMYYFTPNPGQCASTDSMQVSVIPSPSIYAGPDTVVCPNAPMVLTGSGGAIYSWSGGIQNGIPFIPTADGSYIVTGTSLDGCVGTDTIYIEIEDSIIPSFVPSVLEGCAPLEVTFAAPYDSTYTLNWTMEGTQLAGDTVTHSFTGSGCHDVTLKVTSQYGCAYTNTIDSLICVLPNPEVFFIPQPAQLDMTNSKSTMINNSKGAIRYVWNFGDGTPMDSTTNPVHIFPNEESGSYIVTLYGFNEMGCVDSMKVVVRVVEDVVFYIPNAFTPDGDEYNNVFKPIFFSGYDPHDYFFRVYNRWGQLIFESKDADYGWDGVYQQTGKLCQEGTYVWSIEFKTIENDERRKYQGHFTLLK